MIPLMDTTVTIPRLTPAAHGLTPFHRLSGSFHPAGTRQSRPPGPVTSSAKTRREPDPAVSNAGKMQNSRRRAGDATRDHRIRAQAPIVNLLATDKALTEFTAFDALNRSCDRDQPALSATFDFLGHLLTLQGIDTRQPSHARLIKLDRPHRLVADVIHFGERCLLFKQLRAEFLKLDFCHGLLFAGKTEVNAEPEKTKPRVQPKDQSS
jgi:hypothetical protein